MSQGVAEKYLLYTSVVRSEVADAGCETVAQLLFSLNVSLYKHLKRYDGSKLSDVVRFFSDETQAAFLAAKHSLDLALSYSRFEGVSPFSEQNAFHRDLCERVPYQFGSSLEKFWIVSLGR